MEQTNTKITYHYRDACNCKTWGEEIIQGTLTLNQLTPYLIDTEFFIPKDIGLPTFNHTQELKTTMICIQLKNWKQQQTNQQSALMLKLS